MEIRKKVTWIITNGLNKVLICRYSGDKTWKGWDFPWWWIEKKENELECLKREIYEEIGLKEYQFKIENHISKRYYKKYQNPLIIIDKNNKIKKYIWKSESFYLIKANVDNVNLNISNEFDEMKWVKLNQLKNYINNKEKIEFIKKNIKLVSNL